MSHSKKAMIAPDSPCGDHGCRRVVYEVIADGATFGVAGCMTSLIGCADGIEISKI